MKRFLLPTSLYLITVLGSFLLILSSANGKVDPFYLRFTTPKQQNLILGTSRSAQALQPAVFDSTLDVDFFNYSFTVTHSPYGPAYFESIQKKLDPSTKDGLFIVTVDPWSISSSSHEPNNPLTFREKNLAVGTTSWVNLQPNIEYTIENFSGSYYQLLFRKESSLFLHKDGWLEVFVEMDSTSQTKRLKNKIEFYKNEKLPYFQFSTLRLEYLVKTIDFLKRHGHVYLVRMPIHTQMLVIENDLIPHFDTVIKEAIDLSDGYLDLTKKGSSYEYTDGNHLYKTSGKIVSQEVANWMRRIKR